MESVCHWGDCDALVASESNNNTDNIPATGINTILAIKKSKK